MGSLTNSLTLFGPALDCLDVKWKWMMTWKMKQ